MEVPFSQQEIDAIEQLALMCDVSSQKVVIQAIRMYQMYKMNQIQLVFPRVISGCGYTAVEDNEEVVGPGCEESPEPEVSPI